MPKRHGLDMAQGVRIASEGPSVRSLELGALSSAAADFQSSCCITMGVSERDQFLDNPPGIYSVLYPRYVTKSCCIIDVIMNGDGAGMPEGSRSREKEVRPRPMMDSHVWQKNLTRARRSRGYIKLRSSSSHRKELMEGERNDQEQLAYISGLNLEIPVT